MFKIEFKKCFKIQDEQNFENLYTFFFFTNKFIKLKKLPFFFLTLKF